MAATTLYHTITPDEWTQVASGFSFILVQLRSHGVVRMHVGDSEAVVDDDSADIVLARGMSGAESSFSAGGVPDGTAVWLRSVNGSEQVSVLSY